MGLSMKFSLFFLLSLFTLSGCFQYYDEADELRTIPVTNNPHVIPSHSSSLPGMGAG